MRTWIGLEVSSVIVDLLVVHERRGQLLREVGPRPRAPTPAPAPARQVALVRQRGHRGQRALQQAARALPGRGMLYRLLSSF